MEIDIDQWVAEAPVENRLQRQATHVILMGISSNEMLKTSMIIKGGTLLGIRYGSTRFTTDIDFSTEKKLSEINLEDFFNSLNEAMDISESELNYGIKCLLQSYKVKPNPEGTFPTIKIKIGYCQKSNEKQLKRLMDGNFPITIAIDYSFNEKAYGIESLQIGNSEEEILAYDICDLLAEKLRSILQQAERERYREQDIYDVHYLISTIKPLSDTEKDIILKTLIKKSFGKNIDNLLNENGIENEEIIYRSAQGYPNLKDTVRDLPPFDTAYGTTRDFFKSLPWSSL